MSRCPAAELSSARIRRNAQSSAYLDTHMSALTDDCQPTVSLSRAKLMAIRFAYQYRNLSIQPVPDEVLHEYVVRVVLVKRRV